MRTNSVVIVVGKRGTGKTDFCKHLIDGSPMKKKLIVDTFDSPVWRTLETYKNPNGQFTPVPIMAIEQLPYWKSGLYRLFSNDPDFLFEQIDKHISNCLIAFEDSTKYFKGRLQEPVRRLMYDSKQKNLNMIFFFHSLAAVPPELVRIADYLTLFKTNDSAPNLNKYPFPNILPAMEFVKASNNRFENVTLELN